MSHTQRIVTLFAAALIAVGCSDSGEEALPPAETVETTTPLSDTTTPTPTTEEATTSSALSEQALAEAEIRDVVTGWWQLEYDTSEDGSAADVTLESLTGLVRKRVAEYNASLEDGGIIQRVAEPSPIEITAVSVDLASGTAEVDACTGAIAEYIDAETLEVIEIDDPAATQTSVFQIQLVGDEWKITEFLASEASPGGAVPCEVQA